MSEYIYETSAEFDFLGEREVRVFYDYSPADDSVNYPETATINSVEILLDIADHDEPQWIVLKMYVKRDDGSRPVAWDTLDWDDLEAECLQDAESKADYAEGYAEDRDMFRRGE